MNPVRTGFNIFLQSVPRLSVWSLSFEFYPPKPVCVSFLCVFAMHLILLYLINHNIWQGVQIIALLLYSFPQPLFTVSLFGPNVF